MTNQQFGTLNAGMMERAPAAPSVKSSSSLPDHHAHLPPEQALAEAPHEPTPPPLQRLSSPSVFGKRQDGGREALVKADFSPVEERAPAMSQRIAAFFLNDAVPAEDQPHYSGPERRKRDVSPLTERRQSRPNRVKLSLRVTPSEHEWLKRASKSLDRTHQDILSVALSKYLKSLRVSPPRESEIKLSRK
ncbi:MAG: hypothetical protein KUG59_06800 [Parvibaculaceae bacterium]|nr:hypothetical protein [Parvibaculaceae bacterium]